MFFRGTASMKPNTAVCLTLLGVCLLLGVSTGGVSVRRRATATGCASVVVVTGLLYMSGYSDRLRERDPADDQEIGFIEKPFTANGILRRVHELLTHNKISTSPTPS
jgi:hypothetical protein